MSSPIQTATECLLTPADIDAHTLEKVVGQLMSQQVDGAEVYLQFSQQESWSLEDGLVKSGHFAMDRGFGLRVISGEKIGFAFADGIDEQALFHAADTAKRIAHAGKHGAVQLHVAQPFPSVYPSVNPLTSLEDEKKVALLHDIENHARAIDSRVTQVFVSLSGDYDVVAMLNEGGELVADIRPLVSLRVSVVVEDNGRREKGACGGGIRGGYGLFASGEVGKRYAERAVQQAVTSLSAEAAPAGEMPVVLGPGWPAVLLHEAVGHGLEGDFNRKGSSAFSGRLNEQVASPLCTIVDDATLPGRRGSLSVDDEGTPAKNTVLIEKGKLKNYLFDRHNARLMGMAPTGNGRRESYAHCPLPRMTNTYMLPGDSAPEEIIRSVKRGIYAVDFSGGQVDITSGKFVFSMSEAYLIEDGVVKAPVKGATLIGNGPDILHHVSMVGNDLKLDEGIGSCGKDGQTVPVGVGQPTLKLEKITVGGSR